MVRLSKISPHSLAFNLAISAYSLATMSLGNCTLSTQLILICTLACVAQTKAGELLLESFHLTQFKAWLPAAFVVGFTAISLLILVFVFCFGMSAFAALLLSSTLVLALGIYRAQTSEASHQSTINWTDIGVTLILGVAIAALAKIPFSSPRILLSSNLLPIWSDYFIHGVTINSLGSPYSGGGNMELMGENRGFYHYAPYAIPAALQSVSGMTGLALSTSFLLPLSLLIAALGGYAFAVELGGRLSGLITLTVIICFPAYSFFLQSGWFDFHWLVFATPGTGYALGVSAIICASTMLYFRWRDNRALWFTLLLLFSLILIRAHVFLLLAPVIIFGLLLQRWRSNIRLVLLVIAIVTVSGTLALYFSPQLHTLWTVRADPRGYLNLISGMYSFYGEPINLPTHPHTLTAPTQILASIVAVLGIYAALYPLMLWLNIRHTSFRTIDVIPLLLILSFVGLMLFAPFAQNGDLTEYKHRHFPLLYAVIATYTIAYGSRLILRHTNCQGCLRRLGYVFVVLAFFITIVGNRHSNPSYPDIKTMPWAGNYHNQSVPPGLLEAAAYIRTHAQKGDVLAMGVPFVASDPRAFIVEIVSLTGVPAFIARSELKMRGPKCFQATATKRLDFLKELTSIENWADAQLALQAHGIRWFLAAPGDSTNWDSNVTAAVFSTHGITIYDVGIIPSSLTPPAACACNLSDWCI